MAKRRAKIKAKVWRPPPKTVLLWVAYGDSRKPDRYDGLFPEGSTWLSRYAAKRTMKENGWSPSWKLIRCRATFTPIKPAPKRRRK